MRVITFTPQILKDKRKGFPTPHIFCIWAEIVNSLLRNTNPIPLQIQ